MSGCKLSYADAVKKNMHTEKMPPHEKVDMEFAERRNLISTIFTYCAGGDTHLLSTLPKLENKEYHEIIGWLEYKVCEYTMWASESCGKHRDGNARYDYHPNCADCNKRYNEYQESINTIELSITKLRTYIV